jgi:hypothetical protein
VSGLVGLLILAVAGIAVWAARGASATGSRRKRKDSSGGESHWIGDDGGGSRDHGKPHGSSGRDAHESHSGDAGMDAGGADSGSDGGGGDGGGD